MPNARSTAKVTTAMPTLFRRSFAAGSGRRRSEDLFAISSQVKASTQRCPRGTGCKMVCELDTKKTGCRGLPRRPVFFVGFVSIVCHGDRPASQQGGPSHNRSGVGFRDRDCRMTQLLFFNVFNGLIIGRSMR